MAYYDSEDQGEAEEYLGRYESKTNFSGQLTSIEDIQSFMFAGNATLTLVSKKTGTRFTYKVKQAKDWDTNKPRNFWFVGLLRGPDNESDFSYIGHIDRRRQFVFGKKAKVAFDAPSAKAWRWFYPRLDAGLGQDVFEQLEVWHEGRCGRCNRKLTVPLSVASGFGPECINHV